MQNSADKKVSNSTVNVLVFSCQWCVRNSPAEGLEDLQTHQVRLRHIPVMCSGRVDAGMILGSFEKGADGVLVVGCRDGECHYLIGNKVGKENFQRTRNLMHLLGIDDGRADFELLETDAGFVETVLRFEERISSLGRLYSAGEATRDGEEEKTTTGERNRPTTDG